MNRWLHVCQTVDFNTGLISLMANGQLMTDWPGTRGWHYYYNYGPNGTKTLNKVDIFNNTFVIGPYGQAHLWIGKLGMP